MRRAGLLLLSLVLAACAGHDVTVCGGCPGPGYVLRGVPDGLAHAVVTVCVAGAPCATVHEREGLRTDYLQYLTLPAGARWEEYDGRSLRVTVRTPHARWQGTGRLRYRASDGTCDCGALTAEVPLTVVSRPG
jgi:hypothetical protein